MSYEKKIDRQECGRLKYVFVRTLNIKYVYSPWAAGASSFRRG